MLLFSSSVLESITTSDRVTYFYPPLNLIGIVIRPLRLFLNHNEYRNLRILILKITHAPLVAMLWIYESVQYRFTSRDGHKSLSHLRTSNDKKRLWKSQYGTRDGSAIARGLLVTNHVVLSGAEPQILQSAFVSGANGGSTAAAAAANGNSSNASFSAIMRGEAGRNGGGMVKRRKTRKGTIVAQNIKRNDGENVVSKAAQPLSSSFGSADDALDTAVSAAGDHSAQESKSSPAARLIRRARTGSNASSQVGMSDRRAARRSKLAISLLRDIRYRRNLTLPPDTASEAGVSDAGGVRSGEGAKALAARHMTDPDGKYDETVRMRSLSPRQTRTSRRSIDSMSAIPGSLLDDELKNSALESDEDAYDIDDFAPGRVDEYDDDEAAEDEDDDDDDDFLSLYADQTTVRIRGLEEQVSNMQNMIEQMNHLLVQALQKDKAD